MFELLQFANQQSESDQAERIWICRHVDFAAAEYSALRCVKHIGRTIEEYEIIIILNLSELFLEDCESRTAIG